MRKIIVLLAMLSLIVMSGCATSRVWQNKDIKEPSTKEEISIAVAKCEDMEPIARAHQTCHFWRTESWVMIWAYPLNFIGPIVLQSVQKDYVGTMVNCMREAGFEYFEYTKGMSWDAHSGKDYSKSEWLEDQQSKPKSDVEKKEEKRNIPISRRGTNTGWGNRQENDDQSIKECKIRSHDICDQEVKEGTIPQSAFKECQESAYRLCLEQWTP
jgi:uncharacterized protein YceK